MDRLSKARRGTIRVALIIIGLSLYSISCAGYIGRQGFNDVAMSKNTLLSSFRFDIKSPTILWQRLGAGFSFDYVFLRSENLYYSFLNPFDSVSGGSIGIGPRLYPIGYQKITPVIYFGYSRDAITMEETIASTSTEWFGYPSRLGIETTTYHTEQFYFGPEYSPFWGIEIHVAPRGTIKNLHKTWDQVFFSFCYKHSLAKVNYERINQVVYFDDQVYFDNGKIIRGQWKVKDEKINKVLDFGGNQFYIGISVPFP